jgi:hypothetical protein
VELHTICLCINEREGFVTEQTDFDWSPLGSAFWVEAQKTTGASDQQTRFACCRYRDMSATGSARSSGYVGEGVTLRQAGSRAAKSTAVMQLLALASAEGGGSDGTVDAAEAKQILSRLARGSDPSVRIRALEALSKMDEAAKASAAEEGPIDPIKTCSDIKNPLLAAFVLAEHNITKAPDWLKQSFPAAALAATRVRNLNATWSRAFVEEIAEKLGIKLNAVQATKQEAGNGHGAA